MKIVSEIIIKWINKQFNMSTLYAKELTIKMIVIRIIRINKCRVNNNKTVFIMPFKYRTNAFRHSYCYVKRV